MSDVLVGYTDHAHSGVVTLSQIRCMEGGEAAFLARIKEGQCPWNIPVYAKQQAVIAPGA